MSIKQIHAGVDMSAPKMKNSLDFIQLMGSSPVLFFSHTHFLCCICPFPGKHLLRSNRNSLKPPRHFSEELYELNLIPYLKYNFSKLSISHSSPPLLLCQWFYYRSVMYNTLCFHSNSMEAVILNVYQ